MNPRAFVTVVAAVILFIAGASGWALGRVPKDHWLHRSTALNVACGFVAFGIWFFFVFGFLIRV